MMFDFGDELIIDSYRIPWLIWIQLLVTILFIILLFGFSILSSDADSTASSASTAAGRAAILPPPNAHHGGPSSSQTNKAEEIQPAENDAGGNGETIREDQDDDESPLQNSACVRLFKHPSHPCNYLGLAKQTFLKCFGLDSSSGSRSNEEHRKQD